MSMNETNLPTQTTLRRQRRRGFTLTEIAIVLGIVGLILGAIWVAAAAVYNNLRVSHADTESSAACARRAFAVSRQAARTAPASYLTDSYSLLPRPHRSDMVNATLRHTGAALY